MMRLYPRRPSQWLHLDFSCVTHEDVRLMEYTLAEAPEDYAFEQLRVEQSLELHLTHAQSEAIEIQDV